jgi:ubiquinone/menaquinone biosynthesis C-methylase UbiE
MTFIADELLFLQSLVSLDGADVAELGCGKADFARRLVERAGVARVEAFEVDRVQHRKNLDGPAHPKLAFRLGGAERIDLPDASVDGVVMMKSLHHVPMQHLDGALVEIRRVLKPGGWLYVSEPVYAGEFNEIVKLFHDEGEVRAAAYAALQRAGRAGVLERSSSASSLRRSHSVTSVTSPRRSSARRIRSTCSRTRSPRKCDAASRTT